MCSLTGVYGLEDLSAEVLFKGAYSQQHRGEDGVGLAASNGEKTFCVSDLGLVSERLQGFLDQARAILGERILTAVVQTRYPTEGEPTRDNTQPFWGDTQHGFLAYGHNGELTNFSRLRKEFMKVGFILHKSSDSEVFLPAYAMSTKATFEERLGEAAQRLKGAYSIVGVTKDALFAIRDPLGFKPLSVALLNGGYIVSSETCAFLDIEGAQWMRDVEPGTVMTLSREGVKTYRFAEQQTLKPCLFEHVYFARPDSHIAGRNVHLVRVEFGKQLYREHPVDADIVVAVEDSGRSAAEGVAEESGFPLKRGFIRNHYIGRTFTRPMDVLRDRGVNLKLSPLPEVLNGKRVILVEDSIVRGKTAKSRVRLVRQSGAKEVHLYVTSPKIVGDCYYGIDFHREELRTSKMPDDEEFMRYINVDSLVHLSLGGMIEALGHVPVDERARLAYGAKSFCTGCMTLEYPVPREGL